jgi:hypothetical protein
LAEVALVRLAQDSERHWNRQKYNYSFVKTKEARGSPSPSPCKTDQYRWDEVQKAQEAGNYTRDCSNVFKSTDPRGRQMRQIAFDIEPERARGLAPGCYGADGVPNDPDASWMADAPWRQHALPGWEGKPAHKPRLDGGKELLSQRCPGCELLLANAVANTPVVLGVRCGRLGTAKGFLNPLEKMPAGEAPKRAKDPLGPGAHFTQSMAELTSAISPERRRQSESKKGSAVFCSPR